ncbi:hypothetical protein RHECNPAF_122100183 [Rhizobium etli CNPAF512]|nr:hypothetical protein RHECNPAF_122100183 [Rhizobium etli CNPAF512]
MLSSQSICSRSGISDAVNPRPVRKRRTFVTQKNASDYARGQANTGTEQCAAGVISFVAGMDCARFAARGCGIVHRLHCAHYRENREAPLPVRWRSARSIYTDASRAPAVCSSVTKVVGFIVTRQARSAASFSGPPEIRMRSGVRRNRSRFTDMTRALTSWSITLPSLSMKL